MNETQPEWKWPAYMARVYIQQARARINNPVQRDFCFTLLQFASNKRKQALAAIREARTLRKNPEQQIELF